MANRPEPCPAEPDDDRVARLIAGDRRAFRQLHEQYAARIHTFLLRLTHDEAEAGDLAQDVWLRLATHASRLRADTDVGAWLFTVARNRFFSRRRTRLLDRQLLFALGLVGTSSAPTPLLAAAQGQLERSVEQAVAELALHYREVLLLHSIEGFSTREIARMLQVDEVVVRKRLSRARGKLRVRLESVL